MRIERELIRIARLLLSFKYVDTGDYITILSTKKWPKIMVKKDSDDKYDMFIFNSKLSVQKEIDKMIKQNDINLGVIFPQKIYNWDFNNLIELYHSNPREEKHVVNLLWKFIEHTAYMATNYPNIEFYKFISNKELRDLIVKKTYKDINKIGLFNYMSTKEKMNPGNFEEVFGPVEMEKSERITKIDYDRWTIFIDRDVKYDIDTIKKILSNANQKLNSKGLGKLAYGEILAVNTLKGRIIADYEESKDIIRLRTKGMKGSKGELNNLLHEIGHRNYNRFLGNQEKQEIELKYRSAKRGIPAIRDFDLKGGDELINKINNEKYVFSFIEYPNIVVKLIESDNKRKKIGQLYEINSEILMNNFLINGKEPKKNDMSTFFPTSYAFKNSEEMYCELFADWLIGSLNNPAKEWMDELNK